MNKTSPGPWKVELRHDRVPFGVSAADLRYDTDCVCILPTSSAMPVEFIRGNATLIAAAPELAQALCDIRAILNGQDRNEVENEAFHTANRALMLLEGSIAVDRWTGRSGHSIPYAE